MFWSSHLIESILLQLSFMMVCQSGFNPKAGITQDISKGEIYKSYHLVQQYHSWAYILKRWKLLIWKVNMHPNNTAVCSSRDMDATWVPVDRWMDGEVWYIHTQWDITQHREVMSFVATWLDLELSYHKGR